MLEHHASVEFRDFFKIPFSLPELTQLIGGLPVTEFLSSRARSFKNQGWGIVPPAREIALAAILGDPSLLRRPLLAADGKILIGFSEDAYRQVIT